MAVQHQIDELALAVFTIATVTASGRVARNFCGATCGDFASCISSTWKAIPRASRAYAWSSPIEETTGKPRFVAALHQPPVTSPSAAVRAAIMAEHREK